MLFFNKFYVFFFQVNVTMPAFFLENDGFIHGTVMANYTSGAPVYGNLTLKATLTPIIPPNIPRPLGSYNNNTRDPVGYRPPVRQRPIEKYFTFVSNACHLMRIIASY